jgi:hypothetical protein
MTRATRKFRSYDVVILGAGKSDVGMIFRRSKVSSRHSACSNCIQT